MALATDSASDEERQGRFKDKEVTVISQNVTETQDNQDAASHTSSPDVPLFMKLVAIMLVTVIGFGSHWSSGVTGTMKATLKKELKINNTQYAALTTSSDFMSTALMLVSGIVTDRIGGADALLWGNVIFSIGAILIAAATQVRSYQFMIVGSVIQSFGDISTQVAQYKVFSSWFPPSHGFASTVGFELGIGKIGSFVGQATANIIATNLGNFSWVYWMAVFMNIFTNIATLVFWLFTRWAHKRYGGFVDPATGEKLTENSKKFELQKMLQLPWPFWGIVLFSAFETSTAIIFSTNATELAQQRFNVSAVTAGWYSSMSQYLGFFFVPLIGVFIDLFGHRLTIMCICGSGMMIAMALAAWGPSYSGTAASFGVYAVSYLFGPTVIIDSIRTSMWYQEVFGSGYAIKITVNNAMNIIVGIAAGVIQDADDNQYGKVVILYAALASASAIVAFTLMGISFVNVDIRRLQWGRKKRLANGDIINNRKVKFEKDEQGLRNRRISLGFFAALTALILGSWVAYFWGVATNHGD